MQELLEDINALRRGIEALDKRSREQGQPVSQAELAEALARVRAETRVTIDYKAVAEAIQPHLTTPAKLETALTTGTAQLQAVVAQIPREIPVLGKVWGFTSEWLARGVTVFVAALFCLAAYQWKERGEAETRAVGLEQQQAQQQAKLNWLNKGYSDLKRDNPKMAQKYFPPGK